jgi:hypothetical protein
VSSGSGAHLPTKEGSGVATCTVAPNPLGGLRSIVCPTTPDPASLQGGLWATTRPTALRGPQALSIKKILASLPVQQGSHVPNARVPVSNAPDIRAIMGLQDVRAGTPINAYKTCK